MIKLLRWTWRAYRRWQAERLLRWSVALNPEAFNAFILERATEATFMAVKANLRARGTRLCEACTSTRGPLRRVGNVFACPAHLEQVRQRVAEQQRRETAAPHEAAA